MPILYETYANPRGGKVKRRSIRPKRVRSLQEAQPDHFHVIEEYAVSSIYLTPEQLRNHIRNALRQACEEKGEKLEYFKVLRSWAVWKVFYTEYHVEYEAYIGGGSSFNPISHAIVLLILAICLSVLIIFAIWLVKTYLIEPIWGVIPPEVRPYVGTLLLVGAGLAGVAVTVYVIKSLIRR